MNASAEAIATDAALEALRSALRLDPGRTVRLTVGNLREGCLHELKATGLRSAAGEPLRNSTGWYTLNRLPQAAAE